MADIKYIQMFNFVENKLNGFNDATKIEKFPFRKRSEHIWRVYKWAERLIDINEYKELDVDSLLIASLFHDVGYARAADPKFHAENSEIIFREYAKENNFDKKQENFIAYLVKNHSSKNLMDKEDTPIELIILFEADILDETGSMSILWDCMAEGAKDDQSYENVYKHISTNTMKILNGNPMKTKKAKKYWEKKQELAKIFINELEIDLGIN
jgi:uncharacterized protein